MTHEIDWANAPEGAMYYCSETDKSHAAFYTDDFKRVWVEQWPKLGWQEAHQMNERDLPIPRPTSTEIPELTTADVFQKIAEKMTRMVERDTGIPVSQNQTLEVELSALRTQAIADAAEIERLKSDLKAKNNHTMIWRREIIDPSMAHMGAALVALRNGDATAAENYLEPWLDAGGVCYERYTSHEVFFKRFFTDLQCDHKDKAACVAAIAEFSRRMTEDQEQDDEN